ncbi:hypothetical protein HUX88_05890 [Duganella sp. BJB1802]|uniref:hypothetical protein n=1 Tax=unclassified Duganella TaxID=2636909 RepID=UPI0011C186B0|nr:MULTISPECIES: hypothetical protein [unclassified Duganella]NVD70087.1 hypothetical protein [Duganella sp. BJB1802]
MTTLQMELQVFARNLETLLADEGKYVVISGDAILGVYDSFEDATKAGYGRCGLTPFLVKQILPIDEVVFINRDILPQCPV